MTPSHRFTHSRLCFQAVSPRRISEVDLETSATRETQVTTVTNAFSGWLQVFFGLSIHQENVCSFQIKQTKMETTKLERTHHLSNHSLKKILPFNDNIGLSGNYIWRTKVIAGCEEVFSVRSITRVQHAALLRQFVQETGYKMI